MNNKLYFKCILWAIYCLAASSPIVSADEINVGNEIGKTMNASGPTIANIYLSDCKFSIPLEENQHVKFNDPDVIIYETNSRVNIESSAYLWQAETTSGYDWQFRTEGNSNSLWFGSMCSNIREFSTEFITNEKNEDISPEMSLIRQSNDTHCPAKNGINSWAPNNHAGDSKKYVFQELNGENWTGFAIGLKSKDDKKFDSLRFCLVHGDKVLIGATENDTALSLPIDSFQNLIRIISKVRFIEE